MKASHVGCLMALLLPMLTACAPMEVVQWATSPRVFTAVPTPYGTPRPRDMLAQANRRRPIYHTDRNPIPVSLPERVGDRLVVDPVKRSQDAERVVALWLLGYEVPAVILGVATFDPPEWGFRF